VDSSFQNIFNKQRAAHILNFSKLKDQEKNVPATAFIESKKFVFSLSKHVLADSEEAVLQKGLKFSVRYPQSNQDMA
jgi:hypothetical protein